MYRLAACAAVLGLGLPPGLDCAEPSVRTAGRPAGSLDPDAVLAVFKAQWPSADLDYQGVRHRCRAHSAIEVRCSDRTPPGYVAYGGWTRRYRFRLFGEELRWRRESAADFRPYRPFVPYLTERQPDGATARGMQRYRREAFIVRVDATAGRFRPQRLEAVEVLKEYSDGRRSGGELPCPPGSAKRHGAVAGWFGVRARKGRFATPWRGRGDAVSARVRGGRLVGRYRIGERNIRCPSGVLTFEAHAPLPRTYVSK